MVLCYTVKPKHIKYQKVHAMVWDFHCTSGWEEHIARETQTVLYGTTSQMLTIFGNVQNRVVSI